MPDEGPRRDMSDTPFNSKTEAIIEGKGRLCDNCGAETCPCGYGRQLEAENAPRAICLAFLKLP